jgi:hypothetical protein
VVGGVGTDAGAMPSRWAQITTIVIITIISTIVIIITIATIDTTIIWCRC